MKKPITIGLLALTVQSGASAREAFKGWPEDEAGNGNHVGIASKTERLLKREAG